MKILLACEESQACCIAFRMAGHDAFSCDIIPCSGGHPEWHIQGDVLEVLESSTKYDGNDYITFETMDGEEHWIEEGWDMIIAFPPCTDLAVSGARHFAAKRADGRQQKSIDFFLAFTRAKCPRVAIENPIGIMSSHYRKPDQIIQPWQYGHGETKATCLWLKGLPPLVPTQIVEGREHRVWRMPPGPDRAKERSKTYPGIAAAMACQWGVLDG